MQMHAVMLWAAWCKVPMLYVGSGCQSMLALVTGTIRAHMGAVRWFLACLNRT